MELLAINISFFFTLDRYHKIIGLKFLLNDKVVKPKFKNFYSYKYNPKNQIQLEFLY